MTVFVDANVLLYSAEPLPSYDATRAIIAAVREWELEGRTSTAVLEEVWHVESRQRSAQLAGLARRVYDVFTPLLPVTDEIVRRALDLDAGRMGTNDRVHVATCLEHGIATIVTADDDFDGVPGLRRVDPLDAGAVDRLLAGP